MHTCTFLKNIYFFLRYIQSKINVTALTLKIAAPAAAPIHWTTIKNNAFNNFTPPVANIPNVTAGLIWHPLT